MSITDDLKRIGTLPLWITAPLLAAGVGLGGYGVRVTVEEDRQGAQVSQVSEQVVQELRALRAAQVANERRVNELEANALLMERRLRRAHRLLELVCAEHRRIVGCKDFSEGEL